VDGYFAQNSIGERFCVLFCGGLFWFVCFGVCFVFFFLVGFFWGCPAIFHFDSEFPFVSVGRSEVVCPVNRYDFSFVLPLLLKPGM